MRTNYPCDMHCHTTRSDGHDSPLALIEKAAGLGMQVVAITDHDTPPPHNLTTADGEAVNAVTFASSLGLILIPGYEFSTDTWVDEVHICGYNLDWDHPDLQEEVALAARSKSDAYRELCERLTTLGMALDWETDILHFHDNEGKTQVRKPEEVQRKQIFETMAAKGFAESWSAAKLIVRDNPELNVRRRKIDPVAAIDLIHNCGGTAVLAHPYLIDAVVSVPGREPLTRTEYIEHLVSAGLDGIEARYTYDKTTYRGEQTPGEIENDVRARYGDRLRILSGGSDYHGDPDYGKQKRRFLGERGLTLAEFESGWSDSMINKPIGRQETNS